MRVAIGRPARKAPSCRLKLNGQVVVGVGDPNPLVGGTGMDTLRQAGIGVDLVGGAEERECFDINRQFMEEMQAKVAAQQS